MAALLSIPCAAALQVQRQADQAKQVCQACPVRTPCLGFAQRHGLASGIWGGTTEGERRDIRHAVA